MKSERAQGRLQLGAGAVLTVQLAAELLPWRDTKARQWLDERGLVHEVRGYGRVVIWGEVLDELRLAPTAAVPVPTEPPPPSAPRRPAPKGRLPRARL